LPRVWRSWRQILLGILTFAEACASNGGSHSQATADAGPGLIALDGGLCAPAADGAATSSDGGACTPSRVVSFTADVLPILGGCGGENCHTWSRAALVGVPSFECCDRRVLVVPGDPGSSYLMQKLTANGVCLGTSRMPYGSVPLPANDIQTIADWICLGAGAD
jgi:hypothetical protein